MKALFFFFFVFPLLLFGQQDSTRLSNPLQDDAYLHPIDCISPYTLKKGEWVYAQSIQTLPFPSWAFVGITDRLTAQIDLLPWIYGLFSPLKKPIPSLNFRYRFTQQKGLLPTIAVEAMFVHFWDTLQRFDTPQLTMWQNGSYFHFKPVIGYQVGQHWNFNLSAGLDYTGQIIMRNNDSLNSQQTALNRTWNPNFSFGLDFRPSKWISFHAGYSYGPTLTYLENVPRKHQINYGFRVAPFYRNRYGILRHFRMELVAINAFFPDIAARQVFPLPIFPYLYWQWKPRKKSEKVRQMLD